MAVEMQGISINVGAKVSSKGVAPLTKKLEKLTEAANNAKNALAGIPGVNISSSGSSRSSKGSSRSSGGSSRSSGGNAFSKLGSSIKRILLYRAIRTALRQITQAFSEGVKNLYQYSTAMNGSFANAMDRAATSLLYFKNALGTLVAPLIEMAVPLLEKGIDVIVEIINKINEAIAALRGQATYTRAIKYWIKYAEAAEKAKSATIGIDELNVIGDNNGNQLDYTKMFEEAEVGADNVSSALKPLVSIFDDAKMIIGWAKDLITRNLPQISSIFGGIWDNYISPALGAIDNLISQLTQSKAVNTFVDKVFELFDWLATDSSYKSYIGFISDFLSDAIDWVDELDTSIGVLCDLLKELLPLTSPFFMLDWDSLKKGLELIDMVLKPALAMINWLLTATIGLINVLVKGLKDPLNTDNWANAWNEYTTQMSKATKNLEDTFGEAAFKYDDMMGLLTGSIVEAGISSSGREFSGGGQDYNPDTPDTAIVPITVKLDGRVLATQIDKAKIQKGATFTRGYVM